MEKPLLLLKLFKMSSTSGTNSNFLFICFSSNFNNATTVNLVPPNIIRCAAEPGIGELKVSWETYDFDNWSGDSIGYVVYWKKITDDHDENNINLHDYYSRNVKHPLEYVRTVLNDLNNGISSHSHTMHNLGVFTLNSVLLSTKNEEGEGSYEKVTCRTGPGGMFLLFIYLFICLFLR